MLSLIQKIQITLLLVQVVSAVLFLTGIGIEVTRPIAQLGFIPIVSLSVLDLLTDFRIGAR